MHCVWIALVPYLDIRPHLQMCYATKFTTRTMYNSGSNVSRRGELFTNVKQHLPIHQHIYTNVGAHLKNVGLHLHM